MLMASRPHLIRDLIPAMFFARHALEPDDAIAFLQCNPRNQIMFDRLRIRGIVREAAAGRFYFDLEAHYAAVARRRRFAVPIAIVASVVIAWIATLFFRG